MRWQQPIRRLLDRWSDQVDPFGHELRELWSQVIPTVSVGADRVDSERIVWAFEHEGTALAGNRTAVELEGSSGCREIIGAWAWSPGASPDVLVFSRPAAQFATATSSVIGVTQPSSITSPGRTLSVPRVAELWDPALLGFQVRIPVQGGSPTYVEGLVGAIQDPGATLCFQNNAVNGPLSVCVLWREIVGRA